MSQTSRVALWGFRKSRTQRTCEWKVSGWKSHIDHGACPLDDGEDRCNVAALKGTPQGSVISSLLANIYLHYALDLWTRRWRRRYGRGNVIDVRYSDKSMFEFKSEETDRRFLTAMKERLAKFGLTLNAKKSRPVEFGRFAATNRKR